ncbi:MAG: AAA family ATPase [Planctomycetes bacterium]|nr:AAA family ATPase [Planctomycetota bacterium]
MPQACPSCGTPNADVAKFCNECGGKLAPGASKRVTRVVVHPSERRPTGELRVNPAGERRVVSVLFADIKDYTALTARFDPEQIEESVGELLREFSRVVTRQGGYVDKFMGDSVLALFGAPKSYGDDAERACACALEMQRVAADPRFDLRDKSEVVRLQVRVGIETGEVVVGNLGQRGEYTAIGDAVNTANRIQTACEAGAVLIGDETARYVRSRFKLAAQPPATLKGKAEPVVLHRVEGALKSTEHYLGRFIGRTREIDLLMGSFESANRDRHPRFILVRGEAGMGKSRLLYELRRRLRARKLAPLRLTASFSPVGMEPLHGMRQLARAALGIAGELAPEEIQARIADAATRSVSSDETPFFSEQLAFLLGMEKAPSVGGLSFSQRAEVAGVALKRLIEAGANDAALLLVFEDLHWIDDDSLAFLRRLARGNLRGPVVVLALGRPEAIEQVRDLLATPFEVVDLKPLETDELAQLAEGVLHEAGANAGLAALVADRSGGNPFVAEELFKTLHETGMLQLSDSGFALAPGQSAAMIPAGVRSILAARIDALEPLERYVLTAMSVVGREFRLGVAQHLCGEAAGLTIARLVERGMLVDLGEDRGQGRFGFCHALLQEVGYGSMLKRDKLEMHRQTAEFFALQQQREGAADPQRLARRAFHLSRADQPALATALYFKAGKDALAGWQGQFALEQLLHAREEFERCESPPSLEGLPPAESRLALLLELTEACFHTSHFDDVLKHAEELQKLCGASHTTQLAKAAELATRVSVSRGQLEEGLRRVDAALDLLRRANDVIGETRLLLSVKVRVLAQLGRFGDALAILDAVPASILQKADDVYVEFQLARASNLHFQERFEEALAHYRLGLERAEKMKNHRRIAGAHGNIASCLTFLGQIEHVARHFELSLNAYSAAGDLFNLAIVQANYGAYLRRMKRPEEALEMIRRASSLSAEVGDELGVVMGGINIGSCLMGMGDYFQAAREFARVEAAAERVNSPQTRADVAQRAAQASLRLGEIALARRHIDGARKIAETHGLAALKASISSLEIEELLRVGKLADAEAMCRAVLADGGVRKAHKFAITGLLLEIEMLGNRPADMRRTLREMADSLKDDPEAARSGEKLAALYGVAADALEGKPLSELGLAPLLAALPPQVARDEDAEDCAAFAAVVAAALKTPDANAPAALDIVRAALDGAIRSLGFMERGGRQDFYALMTYCARASLHAALGQPDAAESVINLARRLAGRLEAKWVMGAQEEQLRLVTGNLAKAL